MNKVKEEMTEFNENLLFLIQSLNNDNLDNFLNKIEEKL